MKKIIPLTVAICLLAGISAQAAGPAAESSPNPPDRPTMLTAEQFDSLLQIERQPEHQAVLDVHATYESEHEEHMEFVRASDDFWTVVYQGGMPGAIIAVLICAAPL